MGRELSADEQIGQTHSFPTEEAASSEEQKNVGGEFYADEQIGEEHGFAASSREQKNVGEELSADEQLVPTGEAISSEKQNVIEKNVARESVKKDSAALRMAKIMIKVEQIFGDGSR